MARISKDEFLRNWDIFGMSEDEKQMIGLDAAPCQCGSESCDGWFLTMKGLKHKRHIDEKN